MKAVGVMRPSGFVQVALWEACRLGTRNALAIVRDEPLNDLESERIAQQIEMLEENVTTERPP
jgi:hypothetical protein